MLLHSWVSYFSFFPYLPTEANTAVFLPLCTNFMATAGLSYRIYKETRHESAPSMQNKARLRLIAMGLIETGFFYSAIQLSNCVISAIALDRSIRGIFPLPVDILWALAVLGALNAMTPVRVLVHSPALFVTIFSSISVLGNCDDSYYCQNQHYRRDRQSSGFDQRSLCALAAQECFQRYPRTLCNIVVFQSCDISAFIHRDNCIK